MQLRPKADYKQKSAKRLVPKDLSLVYRMTVHIHIGISFTVYCSALGGTLMMTVKRNFVKCTFILSIHFLPLFWVWISEAAV